MDFLNCCTTPFETRAEPDVIGQPLKVLAFFLV
jgi:hypothetical protein